ncbi:MAG: FtsX-like permease family protein, partial [Myxococcaceae bacterium]
LMWAGRYRSNSFLVGVDPGSEDSLFKLLGPTSGSLEGLSQPRSVAVSSRVAERLRVGLGDVITFFVTTTGGQRNSLDGRVVAITRSVGLLGDSAGVVASNAFMRELYAYRPDAAGALQLSCVSTPAEPLADSLRARLRDRGYTVLPSERLAWADKMVPMLREGWKGQRLDVSTWEDEASFLEFVRSGLSALTGLLQFVILAITLGGLFVSMSIAVRERTREIGTMRAIGLGRGAVLASITLEGLLTGAVAGALGAGVAVLACLGLDGRIALGEVIQTLLLMPELGLELVPGRVLGAVALVTVGAAAGTLIPAVRAAFLSPRSAMESVQ